jgi:plastocyanin
VCLDFALAYGLGSNIDPIDRLKQVLAEAAPKGFGLSLAVAVIAIFLAVGAISFAYLGSNAQINNLQSEVSSLQSAQGRLPTNLPLVNQTVSNRNITLQWEQFPRDITQDRFFPDFIIVNQGDTVNLLFLQNDTGDGHTFTMVIPTTAPGCSGGCEYQMNLSQAGLHNFLLNTFFSGPATGCISGGATVPCSQMGVRGAIGNMSGRMQFTVSVPGVYRFFCYYHQGLGMFGWLVVMPNARFH